VLGGEEEAFDVDVEYLMGTSKNGSASEALAMAPDVSWFRRGLVGAISGFLAC
jgi:hypothetical protein